MTAPSTTVHPYLRAIADAEGIGKSSKRLYVRNLQSLVKITGRPLEDLIRRPRETYAAVVRQYPNVQTRKSLIVAIKAVFKYVEGLRCGEEKVWAKWHAIFAKLDGAINERVMQGEPTEREEKNWVRWRDVLAKERELAATAYASDDHLLLAMYTLIEPARQDYNAVYIVSKEPRDKSRGNFIVLSGQPPTTARLYMNDYKTSKTYSTFERDLPDNLTSLIRESLRRRPRKFLFDQEDGTPYLKRNSFTKFSNRVLERLFGKKFTVSMMRHSFISEGVDYNESTPGALFETARHMHHSIAQQQLYRRKVNDPVETAGPTAGTAAPVYPQQQQLLPPAPPPPAPSPPALSSGFHPQEFITITF